MAKYVPAKYKETEYHCPHCSVYAKQHWGRISSDAIHGYAQNIIGWENVICEHCKNTSIWLNAKMIYPAITNIPVPNEDLEPEIKEDYLEAAKIVNISPRGAAALLRLAIQKLCKQLGESGENINSDIANLVDKGLSTQIQQALDTVRVIGNNAVHPGKLDIKDNSIVAIKLFELINIVTQIMITQPKEIEMLYGSLPEKSREKISKRDSQKKIK